MVALIGFADPIRPGIGAALREARDAGIQTIVVTGDHPATAAAIAHAAGLGRERVVTGAELATWDDRHLAEELPRIDVVARSTPEQKERIVRVARAAGRLVAVTGDGVNDAPALHNADVAVAMGSGTAVAREAADLVLGDDSFVTLMYGLREGRRIVDNIQKGLVFLVSTHVAFLGFILIATIAGFGQPLLPIQILWMELFIDSATSIAFEREPEEPDLMNRPPRRAGVPLLTRAILARISLAGAFTAVRDPVADDIAAGQPGARPLGRVLGAGLRPGRACLCQPQPSHSGHLDRAERDPPGRGRRWSCSSSSRSRSCRPLASAFRATPLDLEEWLLVGDDRPPAGVRRRGRPPASADRLGRLTGPSSHGRARASGLSSGRCPS